MDRMPILAKRAINGLGLVASSIHDQNILGAAIEAGANHTINLFSSGVALRTGATCIYSSHIVLS